MYIHVHAWRFLAYVISIASLAVFSRMSVLDFSNGLDMLPEPGTVM